MKITSKTGIRGEYKTILYNPDGSIAQETEWQDNLITDFGLIAYGTFGFPPWYQYCFIGDDNTPAATTDTALISQLAFDADATLVSTGPTATTPLWERYEIRKWRFDAGTGTGTIREIGIGPSSLFSRIVLTTPVVKAANQILDVYYKFYIYPDLTEYTGTVVIKGVTYDWSMKPVNMDVNTGTVTVPNISTFYNPTVYPETATDGDNTNDVTGSAVNHPSVSKAVTAQGSGFTDFYFAIGLDQWVTNTGQIQYISISNATGVRSRLKLTATDGPDPGGGVPKDNTEIIELTVKCIWGRYTP